MTIVVSDRQRIFYRFEGERGAYLLLHHGLLGSHADWERAGYVEALRDEFRLIVMDARGHGRSDRPLEPEPYRISAMAEDVIALMDELEIRNLHFLGYSLGALVGFELLKRHPERLRIVMLAGESPFLSTAMQDDWRALAEEIERDGLTAVRARRVADGRLVATAQEPEAEGEHQAALALLAGLCAEAPRPDEGRISVDTPVALFTGEADPALERMRDARRRIHRARFVSFPGQSHAGLFQERQGLIGELLRLLRPGRRGEGQPTGPGRPEREPGERGMAGTAAASDPPRLASLPLSPPPPVEVPPHLAAVERGDRPPRAEGTPPVPPVPPASAATEAPPAEREHTEASAGEPVAATGPADSWAEPPPEASITPALPTEPALPAEPAPPTEPTPEDLRVRARLEDTDPPELPDAEPEAPWLREASVVPGLPDPQAPAGPTGRDTAGDTGDLGDDDEDDWGDEEDDAR